MVHIRNIDINSQEFVQPTLPQADKSRLRQCALFHGFVYWTSLYANHLQQQCSGAFFLDLIDGFLKMMDAPDDFTGPVNLGNPGEFTIRELAEQVIELTGSNSKIVIARELPEDDPLQRCPDISLLSGAILRDESM